jgi:hypothetical protein
LAILATSAVIAAPASADDRCDRGSRSSRSYVRYDGRYDRSYDRHYTRHDRSYRRPEVQRARASRHGFDSFRDRRRERDLVADRFERVRYRSSDRNARDCYRRY